LAAFTAVTTALLALTSAGRTAGAFGFATLGVAGGAVLIFGFVEEAAVVLELGLTRFTGRSDFFVPTAYLSPSPWRFRARC